MLSSYALRRHPTTTTTITKYILLTVDRSSSSSIPPFSSLSSFCSRTTSAKSILSVKPAQQLFGRSKYLLNPLLKALTKDINQHQKFLLLNRTMSSLNKASILQNIQFNNIQQNGASSNGESFLNNNDTNTNNNSKMHLNNINSTVNNSNNNNGHSNGDDGTYHHNNNNNSHLYRHFSLDQIKEQLRQCDPNCNGHLDLSLDDQTGVGILCINSPQRKNAFSGFMMAQFSDLLDQLENWTKGQVIIIYGAENFFCSGADLKTIRQNNLSDQCGAHFISAMMHSNLTRLERLPLVSVAMIEGKALGGGAEVITACDFRVIASDAQVGFVHARLGVTPGFGGGTRLIRLVGPTKALQLMLSARLIDAQQAQEMGLVQHILPSGVKGEPALKATIEWYRSQYGTITPFASRAIKSIVSNSLQNIPTHQCLEAEAQIFCSVWGREEHKKALASNIKHHK